MFWWFAALPQALPLPAIDACVDGQVDACDVVLADVPEDLREHWAKIRCLGGGPCPREGPEQVHGRVAREACLAGNLSGCMHDPRTFYGRVRFALPASPLLDGRNLYKVEVMTKYSPDAPRVLVCERDWSAHPLLEAFDPAEIGHPLHRAADGTWHRLDKWNYEIMFDHDISLADCTKIDFVGHKEFCPSRLACDAVNGEGEEAAARFCARLLASRNKNAGARLLGPRQRLWNPADLGLWDLGKWVVEEPASVPMDPSHADGVLSAGLFAYSVGADGVSRSCFSSIGDADAVRKLFLNRVATVFGADVANYVYT